MVLQQCSQSMLLGSRLCSLKNSIGSPLFSTFLSSLYRFSFGCISGPGFTSTFPRINRILITVAGRVVSDDKDLSCTAMKLLVRVICRVTVEWTLISVKKGKFSAFRSLDSRDSEKLLAFMKFININHITIVPTKAHILNESSRMLDSISS